MTAAVAAGGVRDLVVVDEHELEPEPDIRGGPDLVGSVADGQTTSRCCHTGLKRDEPVRGHLTAIDCDVVVAANNAGEKAADAVARDAVCRRTSDEPGIADGRWRCATRELSHGLDDCDADAAYHAEGGASLRHQINANACGARLVGRMALGSLQERLDLGRAS